jgi:predicted ATPase
MSDVSKGANLAMKLKRLAAQNIRSFGETKEVDFHDDFTILIGPNGGGKSNLLDIITVGVYQFLGQEWGQSLLLTICDESSSDRPSVAY